MGKIQTPSEEPGFRRRATRDESNQAKRCEYDRDALSTEVEFARELITAQTPLLLLLCQAKQEGFLSVRCWLAAVMSLMLTD